METTRSSADDDERLAEVLGAWQEACDRGEAPDPEEFAAAHPDLTDRIIEHFSALRLIDGALSRLALRAGERVGPYRIEAEVGAGGMGSVYRAVVEGPAPLPPGSRAAVKFLHPHLLRSPDSLSRFRREAEAGTRVDHPNVVRTLQTGTCRLRGVRHHYLAMEYVEGQTLRGLLNELSTVPEELCRHIAAEVAKGLAAIHAAGIVHRDLKPENILITPDQTVKIMDLGVARLAGAASRLSSPGVFVGSVWYAAPEQLSGDPAATDGRADLFALGVVLYELCTGRQPFFDEDVRVAIRRVAEVVPPPVTDLAPGVGSLFAELVRTLMEKEPAGRFPSAAAFLDILRDGERSEWWKVRAARVRASPGPRVRRAPRPTGLLGRDQDLAALLAAFDSARRGSGAVLLIEGEAGIGKTRLVEEFADRLAAGGGKFHLLIGAYPPGGAATSTGAWSTAYREHFGEEDLEAKLRACLASAPALAPAFAALLRGEPAPPGTERLSKDSILTAFVRTTQALARQRPTVVLIEDLHLAPEEGRALFIALATAVPQHPILLLGTRRPADDGGWVAELERLPWADRRTLARLGPKHLFELLEEAFRSRRLAEQLAGRIGAKSDGNPFFAFEIVRGLVESGRVVRRADGTCMSTGAILEIEIPSSALDLVRSRLVSLSEPEREILDVAACAGFRFDPDLVAAALGTGSIAALRILARLQSVHRLVRADGRTFCFDHHQVQEAVYGALPVRLREEYHGAVGKALLARNPAVEGERAVDLCLHFLLAGRGEDALPALDPALDHLVQNHLHGQAIRLARLALDTKGLLGGSARSRLLLRLAEELGHVGRRTEAEEALRGAFHLARAEGDAPLEHRALAALGTCRHLLGRSAEAEEDLTAALAAATASDDRALEASIRYVLATLRLGQGRTDDARAHHERCLEIARAAGDLAMEGKAEAGLGVLCVHLGRYEEAARHYSRRLALCLETGNEEGATSVAVNLGVVHSSQGRYPEALACYERGLESALRSGNRGAEAKIAGNLGTLHYLQGRYPAAREWFERRLAISEEIGDRRGQALTTLNLGTLHGALGEFDEDRRCVERGLALALQVGDRALEAAARGSLGGVLMDLGRPAEALAACESHLLLARETRDSVGEVTALGNLAGISSVLGDPERALDRVGEAIRIAREMAAPREEATALLIAAAAESRRGDDSQAAARAEESLAIWRRIEGYEGLGPALSLLGGIRARQGRSGEARRLLAEAVELEATAPAPGPPTLARCRLAAIVPEAIGAATRAFAESEGRLSLPDRMEARWLLYCATGEPEHLRIARQLLDALVASAPEPARAAMVENVALHRRIREASAVTGP